MVEQIGDVSSGGYQLIFWMFQNPPDVLFQPDQAMTMSTAIVLVGCHYGYTASGGPVGVGTATAKSMVLEHRAGTHHRYVGNAGLLGCETREHRLEAERLSETEETPDAQGSEETPTNSPGGRSRGRKHR